MYRSGVHVRHMLEGVSVFDADGGPVYPTPPGPEDGNTGGGRFSRSLFPSVPADDFVLLSSSFRLKSKKAEAAGQITQHKGRYVRLA